MKFDEQPVSVVYSQTHTCRQHAETRTGPILLGISTSEDSSEISGPGWQDLEPHREEGQVDLDVNRSFVYYPNGNLSKLSSLKGNSLPRRDQD